MCVFLIANKPICSLSFFRIVELRGFFKIDSVSSYKTILFITYKLPWLLLLITVHGCGGSWKLFWINITHVILFIKLSGMFYLFLARLGYINDYVSMNGLCISSLLYFFTERENSPDPTPSETGIKAPNTKAKGLLHCIEHKVYQLLWKLCQMIFRCVIGFNVSFEVSYWNIQRWRKRSKETGEMTWFLWARPCVNI